MKHLLYTELTFNMLVELITKYHSAKDKDVRNLVIKNNNDHKGMVIRVNGAIENMNPESKLNADELMFKIALDENTKGTSWAPKIVDVTTSTFEVYEISRF